MTNKIHIGFLLYPGATQLDITGPAQVLNLVPAVVIHMLWKTLEPIETDAGFSINPTDTFETCPDLDVVCVGGGIGQAKFMDDEDVLNFLRQQAEGAQYVTSVCTGSLLLGAAGLIDGYKSACHWAYMERLTNFGAIPVPQRIVRDRNRLSGGGVTAGIDFALALVAELVGDKQAQAIQLMLEYSPAPPFNTGSPTTAGPEIEARVRTLLEQARHAQAAIDAQDHGQ